ncbi:MAG: hypothetical protein AB7N70_34180 [Dehalococcoidia bacterium]
MKQRFSPVIFGMTYCVVYVVALSREAALFLYYPRVGRFAWGWDSLPDAGPSMAWYGLMASAALAGIITGVVLAQEKLLVMLQRFLWMFPMFAMVGTAYLMRHFFLL